MASGNMSPSEVRSTVNALDESKKTTTPKAVQKGTSLGGTSNAGGHKESGFHRGPNGGKE